MAIALHELSFFCVYECVCWIESTAHLVITDELLSLSSLVTLCIWKLVLSNIFQKVLEKWK